MSYADKILPSIYGRRLGLQMMSSAVTGSVRALAEQPDMLVGTEDIRKGVSTGETTALAMKAYGVSRLFGTSVASTPVYTLDTPIPGVEKFINFESTDSAIYVKTGSGVFITGTSLGSSAAAIRSSGGGAVVLMGVTTAAYAALQVSSSGVNGIAFQATT